MTKIKESSTNFANKTALADECPEVYATKPYWRPMVFGDMFLVVEWEIEIWRIEKAFTKHNRKNADPAVKKTGSK